MGHLRDFLIVACSSFLGYWVVKFYHLVLGWCFISVVLLLVYYLRSKPGPSLPHTSSPNQSASPLLDQNLSGQEIPMFSDEPLPSVPPAAVELKEEDDDDG